MNGLLNVVGLTIGFALYAMLLAMVLGARHQRARLDNLALATACLGLAWNLCAIGMFELPALAPRWVAVCGFSALGFLPAVVVHSVLRGDGGVGGNRIRLLLRTTAYGASSIAAILHVEAALAGHTIPSVLGFRLLTGWFVGMLIPLGLLTSGQPGARRTLWGVALAAFAVSALHLSQYERATASWPIELVGHNASIPLAVAILYQEYPFAFADLFVKRALILIALVACVSAALWITGIGALLASPAQLAAFILLWVATAIAYPWIASAAGWFVDAIVLTRPNYRSIEGLLARRLQLHDEVDEVLNEVCRQLSLALGAKSVNWIEDEGGASVDVSALVTVDAGRRAEVRVPVAERPRYRIQIEDLTGGRRILSGDEAMLSGVAMLAARRVDGLRLAQERYAQRMREREMSQLATEAELRALRAQLNPHFLFNALTTIGYLIQTAPDRAVDTLLRLTTLLRSVLRPEGEFTTLGRELELVDAYLSIELARFEDRLRVHVEAAPACRAVRIPSLLIQPLVENAIKHGIAPMRSGGTVVIAARLSESVEGQRLTVAVTNTAARTLPTPRSAWDRGVGLRSVERRLAVHYGPSGTLRVDVRSPTETVVEVSVPVPVDAAASRAVGSAS